MKGWLTAMSCVLVGFAFGVRAQPAHVGFHAEATVVDAETKQAVPYASVGLVGTYVGTSTNLDGQFRLSLDRTKIRAGMQLRVSCVGYESATFPLEQVPPTIVLKPSRMELKEVLVVGRDLRPDRIVRKAFSRIRQNYYSKPFVYKAFYRHYCKDDSVYGRLIEAAVDIYKRNGHKAVTSSPGQRDEVRVTQLRRSLDSTRIGQWHAPMALYSVMGADLVSYQNRSGGIGGAIMSFAYGVSSLKRDLSKYDFTLEGLTQYDGQEVFEISFRSREDAGFTLSTGISLKKQTVGTLYINANDYAFVKADYTAYAHDTVHVVNTFQKSGGKYFLRHVSKEGKTYNRQIGFRHTYHLDLLVNEWQLKGFTKFKGKEPGKKELFDVPYDSTFWNDYTILKETPLEEKIVRDLGGSRSLTRQYAIYDTLKRREYEREISGEGRFDQFREASKGHRILYVDFWASWCGPCIAEFAAEKQMAEEYQNKITFVMLSMDADEKAWNRALAKHDLRSRGIFHFRIGPEADLLKFFEVDAIPRYVIINKKGEFFDLTAKRPSDPALRADFEKVRAASDQ
jgi:thiol-disulfide isomerase/thioredoxin